MRDIAHIAIHSTNTPEGHPWPTKQDLNVKHRQLGYRTIGFHFVIDRSGFVHIGRKLEEPAILSRDIERTAIAIAYVGGEGADTRTDEQKEALEAVLKQLLFHHPMARIVGRKANFEVSEWCRSVGIGA